MRAHVRRIDLGAVLVLAVVASGPALAQPAASPDRPARIPVERFHRVDDRLYRGAQPTEAGFRALQALGVRTVVNLRDERDSTARNEQQIVEGLGMRYMHLPIKDGSFFTQSRRIPDDTVRRFFEILDAADPGPLFVHCRRGADRTGAIVGFYRIAKNGWDGERAVKEAREVGMRSWYRGLQRQIREFSAAALRTNPD